MDQIRRKLKNENEAYRTLKLTNKYLTRRDINSCQEITIKIDTAIKLGKTEFIHFGGDFYGNFDCEEFKLLKLRYRNEADFKIYGSVSNMKILYNSETDKVDINLI